MTDLADVKTRVGNYLAAIVSLAHRGALAGRPGPWMDISTRADDLARRRHSNGSCQPALHSHYMELVLWGDVLRADVLPARHVAIEQAIHRLGAELASDTLDDVGALIDLACPTQHEMAEDSRPSPLLEEVLVLRQLREAERRGSATALKAALRATTTLAELTDDQGGGHPRCSPWPVLCASHVLTRTLWETVPSQHRAILARLVQVMFFAEHAPEATRPAFLHETPGEHLAAGDGPFRAFIPAWQFVPTKQRAQDEPQLDGEPWLVGDLEQQVVEHLARSRQRQQEIDELMRRFASGPS